MAGDECPASRRPDGLYRDAPLMITDDIRRALL
jgi:hypothetical protein